VPMRPESRCPPGAAGPIPVAATLNVVEKAILPLPGFLPLQLGLGGGQDLPHRIQCALIQCQQLVAVDHSGIVCSAASREQSLTRELKTRNHIPVSSDALLHF
jgi:hypothetical protein